MASSEIGEVTKEMKVGDLVEWKGHKTASTEAIYEAGGIGVVTDVFTDTMSYLTKKEYCRVLFPAPAGELAVHPCLLKVLS